ncbi:GH24006 [Drosophila grimshawi]|nr:GH24006 [Drosophila grimshawi]
MSAKRKSPPNKIDGDSNSLEGLVEVATSGRQFQCNLNEISAAKMQQHFLNNNNINNYNDSDVVRNSNDCDFICNSQLTTVDSEGEGEAEAEGEGEAEGDGEGEESLMRMDLGLGLGLGLGLSMVSSASDGEHTDLDIDTSSISPKLASFNESDVDNALLVANTKRFKKSSKTRPVNGISKMATHSQNLVDTVDAAVYPVMNSDVDEVEEVGASLHSLNSQYSSTVIKEEQIETQSTRLSTVVTEPDVIAMEYSVFQQLPCRDSVANKHLLDGEQFLQLPSLIAPESDLGKQIR